jgi:hypothetical protein
VTGLRRPAPSRSPCSTTPSARCSLSGTHSSETEKTSDPPDVTRVEWEHPWERIDELSEALDQVGLTVNQYAQLLAALAEVPALSSWDAA